jgi:hypothetical protein
MLLLAKTFKEIGSVLSHRRYCSGGKRKSTDYTSFAVAKKGQRRLKRWSVQRMVHDLRVFSYRLQISHQFRVPYMKQGCFFCALTSVSVHVNESFLCSVWLSDERSFLPVVQDLRRFFRARNFPASRCYDPQCQALYYWHCSAERQHRRVLQSIPRTSTQGMSDSLRHRSEEGLERDGAYLKHVFFNKLLYTSHMTC